MSIVHLKLGGSFLEIFAYKESLSKPRANYQYGNNLPEIGVKHIALQTDNIEAALADLQSKSLADESTTIMFGSNVSFFFIQDPDGMWVELIKDDRYD